MIGKSSSNCRIYLHQSALFPLSSTYHFMPQMSGYHSHFDASFSATPPAFTWFPLWFVKIWRDTEAKYKHMITSTDICSMTEPFCEAYLSIFWFSRSFSQTSQDICCVVFALFNVVWATLFLERWKRREAELAYRWGTLDTPAESLEEPRPQFRVRGCTSEHVQIKKLCFCCGCTEALFNSLKYLLSPSNQNLFTGNLISRALCRFHKLSATWVTECLSHVELWTSSACFTGCATV